VSASATSRLGRLVSLVPYLVAHPRTPMADVARLYGVDETQLREDLELLFLCGLPGYSPGDLIEVDIDDEGRITVENADAMSRPLRLTPDEALALVVAARSLAAVPGLQEREALDRALAKLDSVVGSVPGQVAVELDPEGEALAVAQAALAQQRRLHLRYLSGAREEETERDVDPLRVLSVDGRWYLEGWCHRAEDVRTFRLDRVLSSELLDQAASPPAVTAPDLSEGVFQPRADYPLVVLDVLPAARWVADYYPCESVEPLPNGGARLALRVGDTEWVHRLALRLGANSAVVEPPELRADVAEAARAALAAYQA
jgi:proteasome accessory factor C